MENDLKKHIRFDIPYRFNEFYLLKKHMSRVINVFEGNTLPPYEILIHPSSICNLCCKWCIGNFVASKEDKEKLLENNLFSEQNMEKIIDDIINYKKTGYNYETNKFEEFKIENVSFSGITGEPFVAKKSIKYAINKLASKGIRVGVFTNGSLISSDMYDTILKMGYILISLDATDEEIYDKLKCGGRRLEIFNKILDTIYALNCRKKEINSKTDINIGYIINQYNYRDIYKIAEKLKEIGVHYLRFKTDIASLLNLTDDQRMYAHNEIEKIKTNLVDEYFSVVEIHDVLDDEKKVRKFEKCFIHYLIGNISADGNVYPCNYHPKKNGYNYDSALKKEFSLIWDNMRQYDVDNDLPNICPDVCDPFKNRANFLLNKAYEIYLNKGLEYLIECINDIENEIKS